MIDLSHIPDEVIFAEAGKRTAKLETNGRPKKPRPCPKCGQAFGARDLRAHIPRCTAKNPS